MWHVRPNQRPLLYAGRAGERCPDGRLLVPTRRRQLRIAAVRDFSRRRLRSGPATGVHYNPEGNFRAQLTSVGLW